MNLVERVQNILLKPQDEWRVIQGEDIAPAVLLRYYVAPLAAIPAVAGFIGMALVGGSLFGMSMRVGVASALVSAIVSYGLSFVAVFLTALTVDWLAPKFKSTPSQAMAFKLAVFAWTPAWIGGIFQIVPSLAPLGLLAALYGGYLIYVGVKELMNTPAEEAATYTVVIMLAVLVLMAVIGAIVQGSIGPRIY